MYRKRRVSQVLQDCLDKITPEERAKTDLYLECLADWKTCYGDILNAAKEEGLDITDENRDSFIIVSEYFYIKGVIDAYNKIVSKYNKAIKRLK